MRLADVDADESSFAFRDLTDADVWTTFTPVFGSLTVVGATSYSGRLRFVGRYLQVRVKFSAATSIASTAGTTYLTPPAPIKGLGDIGEMANLTTNAGVGVVVANATDQKIYMPAQVASGNTFLISVDYEV